MESSLWIEFLEKYYAYSLGYPIVKSRCTEFLKDWFTNVLFSLIPQLISRNSEANIFISGRDRWSPNSLSPNVAVRVAAVSAMGRWKCAGDTSLQGACRSCTVTQASVWTWWADTSLVPHWPLSLEVMVGS